MEFTFYGHACFKIDTGKESLLFDPFLSGNSQAAVSADKVECDYILLSHAHGDHFGDADKIASRTGAGFPQLRSSRRHALRVHHTV